MKKILLIIFTVLPYLSFGQMEKQEYESIIESFERHYNNNDYKEIFDSFAPDMQRALPLEKTVGFFSGLKQQVGNIEDWKFLRSGKDTYLIFETKFDYKTLAIHISIDVDQKINGFLVKNLQEKQQKLASSNQTLLSLPFDEEWIVLWGGNNKDINYHADMKAQRYAFDFLVTDENGKTYSGDGLRNEDYFAFEKELKAPCDAVVVTVIDGIYDNQPGEVNHFHIPGNTVVLKTEHDEFLFFAHFKQNSIAVKQGQRVERGDLLGLCGNSGNSSEPHLHFHIQNQNSINKADGMMCYFHNILVNGVLKAKYSPIKGEKVKND